MSVPGVVQTALGDEQVAAQVSLGSEDQLFVTPTRTIIYRGDGLLSDEAVEEYTHDAERIEVSKGRRKARITLIHGIEGERSFTVPPKLLDDALHPVLAGVLNAAGVTEPGETVKRTFRFSELTVIVTSRRLLKHIGEAVWDEDYEEYHYEKATGLDFEEGSVATQVVLEVDGRRERIKAPNDAAPELRREIEEALFDFFDVDDYAQFERETNPETEQEEPEATEAPTEEEEVAFGGGVSPLSVQDDDDDDADTGGARPGGQEATASVDQVDAGGAEPALSESAVEHEPGASGDDSAAGSSEEPQQQASGGDADTGSIGSTTDSASPEATADPTNGLGERRVDVDDTDGDGVSNEELAERLDDLTNAVKQQNALLETHASTIEQLIEELKRMN